MDGKDARDIRGQMRILVTGHRGFIGSYIYNPSMEGCSRRDGQDYGDICGQEFDIVVHLAGSVSVAESVQNPDLYFINNTFKLLRFLRNNKVNRMIYASSGGAVYGNLIGAREEQACWKNCLSPYAQSKYLGEYVIREMCPNHVILRISNAFSSDNNPERTIHWHLMNDNPITVFGNSVRDFILVQDVASAIKRAIVGSMTGTFNIGSGIGSSILKMANDIAMFRSRITGHQIFVTQKSATPGAVEFMTLDITKAQKAGLL